ncbi:Papilin [Eumeta japonica]|uniref:Papilin n=1 Tax=Eumeta variegata TaxID=151549 RepID=A0A4C1X7U9_EUMVA|nr:Papilin [Eumeta japonica]
MVGPDACKLPKVKGVCDGYNLRWYFDQARGQCGQFVYGGCLGNDNNFETREACQTQCEPPKREDGCISIPSLYLNLEHVPDQCKQPIEAGSCAGSFPRWAFNAETRKCEQFTWSGCEGNHNKFLSEQACIHRCDAPGVLKEECSLPQEVGNCTEKLAKWSFSQPENRCVPFYYTGCGGNGNRYDDERTCAHECPSAYGKSAGIDGARRERRRGRFALVVIAKFRRARS